ncbi:hypothetical protein F1728_27255 [Gimesia benthica]|uniref:Jacalin-type lectin domain-containing protein n=1 Tax=Gimesia benthica TaxID=2608982 RepID=A0A6I6AKM5_9PLAN|nr:hypothetical protein [Gimesia benthica]QGQ26152.1 hypothetical protein F1728_27255 [Gimesia benthica]
MGIWNFLTKPIKLTSDKFYWQEPLGMRLSLRGDLLIRLGVALTVWAAVSGLFWILFAFNVKPPELGMAMFVSIFIGLGPACLALFMRREHVSASIWIYDDHLIRQRSYVSLALISSWKEISEWPNPAITRVTFIPAEDLGKSFSVMLLSIDNEVELVGIPSKIRLKELARHFTEAGIPVEKRDAIPARYTQGFSPKVFAGMAVLGVLLFSGGLAFNLTRVPRAGQRIAVRENRRPQIPRPEFERPAIPIPVQGNPIQRNPNPSSPQSETGLPRNQPVLTQPGSFPNPIPPRSVTRSTPATTKGTASKLIGNAEGGGPFQSVIPEGKTLLGFECSLGSWAGEPAIRSLTPLSERKPARKRNITVMAKEGYAVGGMKIDAPKYVSAVQVVFYRLTDDGQLDPNDSYTSDWLGTPSGKEVPVIEGAGKQVIGIHGRRGAVLDALGLVFE